MGAPISLHPAPARPRRVHWRGGACKRHGRRDLDSHDCGSAAGTDRAEPIARSVAVPDRSGYRCMGGRMVATAHRPAALHMSDDFRKGCHVGVHREVHRVRTLPGGLWRPLSSTLPGVSYRAAEWPGVAGSGLSASGRGTEKGDIGGHSCRGGSQPLRPDRREADALDAHQKARRPIGMNDSSFCFRRRFRHLAGIVSCSRENRRPSYKIEITRCMNGRGEHFVGGQPRSQCSLHL
jgi:hypothetical protein